jgi:hypothetical protein
MGEGAGGGEDWRGFPPYPNLPPPGGKGCVPLPCQPSAGERGGGEAARACFTPAVAPPARRDLVSDGEMLRHKLTPRVNCRRSSAAVRSWEGDQAFVKRPNQIEELELAVARE